MSALGQKRTLRLVSPRCLYPQKRTFGGETGMSALCQQRTHALPSKQCQAYDKYHFVTVVIRPRILARIGLDRKFALHRWLGLLKNPGGHTRRGPDFVYLNQPIKVGSLCACATQPPGCSCPGCGTECQQHRSHYWPARLVQSRHCPAASPCAGANTGSPRRYRGSW